jgi:CBS domain containing-hemolysin-like protein
MIIDEFGTVQGIVTRTDLLEAVAGRLPDVDAKPEPKYRVGKTGRFLSMRRHRWATQPLAWD